MKRQGISMLAAAIAIALTAPAFASVPSTSAGVKQSQPDQLAAKGKKPSKKGPPKA